MPHQLVRSHYSPDGLEARIRAALGKAGISSIDGPIQPESLAALDQFHAGGLAATIDLIELLDPAPGARVLDVGSGLGGPARVLASRRRCHVTGIDLVPEYVAIAGWLSELCGLEASTSFTQGDAGVMSLAHASFDHAWSLHVAMNIQDRRRFYAGVRHAIKGGGRFVSYDVVASDHPSLRFPVPWASTEDLSHLSTPQGTCDALARAGFAKVHSIDRTQQARASLAQASAGPAGATPALSLGAVLGPRTAEMVANFAHALQVGTARVIAFIATGPSH